MTTGDPASSRLADLLHGAEPEMPPATITRRRAAKSGHADTGQDSLPRGK